MKIVDITWEKGRPYFFALPETPSTGYIWEVVDIYDPEERIDISYCYADDPPKPSFSTSNYDFYGMNMIKIFTIVPTATGVWEMIFTLHRPWNDDRQDNIKFVLRVKE